MTSSIQRELGRLETRLAALETDAAQLVRDVREIRDALHAARGGWRALALVIAMSSTLGAAAGTLWPLLGQR